jgi:hypothetical protein
MDASGQLDFHTSPYFPGSLRALGASLLLTIILPTHILAKIPFVLIGVILITSHYRLRFDMINKAYFDYIWVLGLRFGTWEKFEQIEYLFIKRNRMRQNMNSMMSTTTIHTAVYDGYLRISENNKIHLLTSRDKEAVMKKLKALSSLLQVDILDYTAD